MAAVMAVAVAVADDWVYLGLIADKTKAKSFGDPYPNPLLSFDLKVLAKVYLCKNPTY